MLYKLSPCICTTPAYIAEHDRANFLLHFFDNYFPSISKYYKRITKDLKSGNNCNKIFSASIFNFYYYIFIFYRFNTFFSYFLFWLLLIRLYLSLLSLFLFQFILFLNFVYLFNLRLFKIRMVFNYFCRSKIVKKFNALIYIFTVFAKLKRVSAD
jgi:hypothetical protein